MRLVKCDRCGKIMTESTKPISVNIMYSEEWRTQSIDICPECNDSFNEWLAAEGDTTKVDELKAYYSMIKKEESEYVEPALEEEPVQEP